MNSLEKLRTSKLRYVAPNAMTAARPVLGELGRRALKAGKLGKGETLFTIAGLTDMEGNVARFLRASSLFGAQADPVADGILRAQAAVAFAPHMKSATAAVAALEIDNLRMNAKIQKGQENPVVPKGAKVGSAVEATGAFMFMEGKRRENKVLRGAGQVTMVTGAATRWVTYRRLFTRLPK